MSENATKFGIRGKITNLTGTSDREIYEYFKEKGILPTEDFEEEDYLIYDDKTKIFVPMIRGSGDLKEVFVDYLFIHQYPSYDYEVNLQFGEVTKITYELCKKFDINAEDVYIFGYTWYTGTDEPFYIG